MAEKAGFAVSVSAVALVAAGPAAAQEFYGGLVLDFGEIERSTLSGPVDDDLETLSILGGVHFSTPGRFFYGAEIETTVVTNYSDSLGLGGNDFDRISRLRAVGGYTFDTFSVFAAVGANRYQGRLGGLDMDDPSGTTYAIGADIPVGERVDLRVEAIRDELDFNFSGFGYHADFSRNALRIGAIVKF